MVTAIIHYLCIHTCQFFCVFFCVFFCFSIGLVRLYIAGLPLRSCRTIGAPSVQGSAQCASFRFWLQQDSNPRPGDNHADVLPLCHFDPPVRDWSLITGKGGYKMGNSRVRNFFAPPPPQDSNTFRAPPPFKVWKLFILPLQYGYNFKLLHKNYRKTCCPSPLQHG